MGRPGGDPEFLERVFETGLRRAEAEANAMRAAGRADASRRVAAAEVERREMLTAAMYRVSLGLREAEVRAAEILQQAVEHRRQSMREAVEEREQIRAEALRDAARIREDASEEAAKLLSKLSTERDHILADARDDARRIVDAAYETGWVDDGALPTEDDEKLFGPIDQSEDEDSSAEEISEPSRDDVWLVNLDDLFDEDDSDPQGPRTSTGTWKRARRRRWYQPRR